MFDFLFRKPSRNFVRIPLAISGRLYASPMPYGPYDPFNRLIKDYRTHRIDAVVPLVTDDEIAKKAARDILQLYAKEGFEVIRLVIPDLTSPRLEEISAAVEAIVDKLAGGGRVVVHCNAGLGRTGIVLACLVSRVEQVDGDAAIAHVRHFLNLNMTDEQMRLVHKWTAAKKIANRLE